MENRKPAKNKKRKRLGNGGAGSSFGKTFFHRKKKETDFSVSDRAKRDFQFSEAETLRI